MWSEYPYDNEFHVFPVLSDRSNGVDLEAESDVFVRMTNSIYGTAFLLESIRFRLGTDLN